MNIQTILSRIEKLQEESPALFGIMTAQHMIEHLILTVKLSYGRIKIPDFEPNEKQLAQKQALLFSDMEFPKGVKAPGLPESLMALKYANLEEAKAELLKALSAYNEAFQENSELKTLHPRFGKLSHEEWERFHTKHFDHHLGQFEV